MDVYQLCESVDGEIVSNVAQVRQGMNYVVLAKLVGAEWQFTPEGEEMVKLLEADPTPKKRTRKAAEE